MFFSLLYLSINSGGLVSSFITPILRADVQCFGEETCFPLAFGVPAILKAASIIRLYNQARSNGCFKSSTHSSVNSRFSICYLSTFRKMWSIGQNTLQTYPPDNYMITIVNRAPCTINIHALSGSIKPGEKVMIPAIEFETKQEWSISPANCNSTVEPLSYNVFSNDSLLETMVILQLQNKLHAVKVWSKNDKQEESSISILWLIPQYIMLTSGEVMFSITGMEFSYSQAPKSMKSVLQAAWLLTIAFGNLIVLIIAKLELFEKQSNEFFMFAGLMILDMVLFATMAYFYKPVKTNSDEAETDGKLTFSDSNYGNITEKSPLPNKKGFTNKSFQEVR